jgi:hypothetical protein
MGVRTVTRPDAQEKVRNELLKSSLYDDLPLAQVESVIMGGDLAEACMRYSSSPYRSYSRWSKTVL